MPAPPGRTVARSTFLAGMALAAALGVAGAGILFTLRDQVTETASVGAPHAIHEGGPDDRFGQRGGGRDAGQDWSTRNDTGRHGPQAPGDGRTPPGGGRHGGDGFHHQDDATGTPQLDATGTPEPDASSAPEASQSPS